jgi:two-component system, LuxR family, response regulator FixJ
MNDNAAENPIIPQVFLIDDDEPVLTAVALLMKSAGLECRTYSSALAFLEEFDPEKPGCVVTDMRMPGMSGLDLQEELSRRDYAPPMILITGHGDVSAAVRAMKQGAADFIEKPFSDQILLDAVMKAIDRDRIQRQDLAKSRQRQDRFANLSEREHEVMTGVVAGKPNKIIADDLGLSIKTVEFHRSNVMAKLKVESVAELVQMVISTRHKP